MSDLVNYFAKIQGVEPEEYERGIRESIKEAMAVRDATPERKALWDQLSPDGKEPTVDEFLMFCIGCTK